MTMTTGSFVRTFIYLGCAMLLIFAKPAPRARVPLERQIVAKNLATFDDLDFNVFSNQRWDDLSKSHSRDIIVHWPDGHTTSGIEQHIADLRAMFVYAPDTRIKSHPVKFGSGEWTCVIGEMEGTFTKPMPIGHARSLQPTGRHFRVPMSTIGRWKDGVMVEEFLFWDNQAYSKQLGL